ncbi:DUF222 domain-containing protein [Georgenia sp. Z1344]|uniref:HNH endonuclease signature motif containing protein n=1 Tax=Georgenia sp. Z1344 TaxID=3416706 RepID=UPI003CE85549
MANLDDWWERQPSRDWAAEDPMSADNLEAQPLSDVDLDEWFTSELGLDGEHEYAELHPHFPCYDEMVDSAEPHFWWPGADSASESAGPKGANGSGDDAEYRDPVESLRAVVAEFDRAVETNWHAQTGSTVHEAHRLIEMAERQIASAKAGVLTAAEANGLWAIEGWRTFKAFVRHTTGTTSGAAGRQVTRSRALREHLPHTHTALGKGLIGIEHVNILVREALRTSNLKKQLLDEELGEEFLVAQAQLMTADEFSKVVRTWAMMADPEAADEAWREAETKEELTIAPTLDGYHVAGWLDELSGRVVHEALDAHMGTKSAEDTRTPAQRRAAALVSLAHQSLDVGLQGAHARVRPHVTVTVEIETLRALAAATGSVVPPVDEASADDRPIDGPDVGSSAFFPPHSDLAALRRLGGPREAGTDEPLFELSDDAREWLQAWSPGDAHVISTAIDPRAMAGVAPATLEDGTPIPPALLSRLTCESSLSRVIFGPDSTVLDVGREQRIFPAHMVRAIHARDRHCQFPGCDEPPGFGEIHHSLQWARDNGPTSVEHGILLCWHHHDWVHANTVSIVRDDGEWRFYDRNGRLLKAQRTVSSLASGFSDAGERENDYGSRASGGTGNPLAPTEQPGR